MKINKKSDLYNASIEEIQAFFKSVIFKGQFPLPEWQTS